MAHCREKVRDPHGIDMQEPLNGKDAIINSEMKLFLQCLGTFFYGLMRVSHIHFEFNTDIFSEGL